MPRTRAFPVLKVVMQYTCRAPVAYGHMRPRVPRSAGNGQVWSVLAVHAQSLYAMTARIGDATVKLATDWPIV
jgi:hypothetical protein